MSNNNNKSTKQSGQPLAGQGLIQEVAIGGILSDKLITENTVKKG
jgi:hypothetical protein